jgi:hypothetical protein
MILTLPPSALVVHRFPSVLSFDFLEFFGCASEIVSDQLDGLCVGSRPPGGRFGTIYMWSIAACLTIYIL